MEGFINIHTHNSNSLVKTGVVNAKLFESIHQYTYCSIGIHPWEVNNINIDESLIWLKENICKANVIAMGEIGIDRVIKTPVEMQRMIFKQQCEMAIEIEKPLIIHCVRAWSDLLSIRKELKTMIPWIFHGFNGSLDTAKQIVKSGCYLSFGKALLNVSRVQTVLKKLPLDCFFFETDDSAIEIEEVYEFAANLRHICSLDLKEIVNVNYLKLFGE